MSSKGVPKSEAHKKKIGLGNKGIHLNKANDGTLVARDGNKLCSKCGKWKSISDFHKRPDRPIGVKPKCKKCELDYQKNNPQMMCLARYKSAAKRRGFTFELDKELFLTFWQKPCFYCGSAIETIGLDRVNSNEGYRIDNVVPCCSICNTMKLALPREVFIEHCFKVIKNQGLVPD
jgi:hypothetical protein